MITKKVPMIQASHRFSMKMNLEQKRDLHLKLTSKGQILSEKMHSYLEKFSHSNFGYFLIVNWILNSELFYKRGQEI